MDSVEGENVSQATIVTGMYRLLETECVELSQPCNVSGSPPAWMDDMATGLNVYEKRGCTQITQPPAMSRCSCECISVYVCGVCVCRPYVRLCGLCWANGSVVT